MKRKPEMKEAFEAVSATRVGVKANDRKNWRFYVKGNRFVSRFTKAL
ncbi:MAG: hypothetical protein U9O89_01870 [Thermoproteota archaeon]|nr:hypothetical protein [Thermoproteota archaeon]